MLPTLQLKIATSMMAGWLSASSPAPVPVEGIALVADARASAPVDVTLYDENLRVTERVLLERDGSADPETSHRLTHLFRCRFTGHQAPMAQRTLAMLADLADRYEGRQIDFVSAHRASRKESWTSPHRASRALDFRIKGADLREVRDYLWRKYTEVGVGWYPYEGFVHMDTRPGKLDTSWTFLRGTNYYNPYWSTAARARIEDAPEARKPGQRPARRPGS